MTNLKRTRSNLVKRLRKPRVFIEWNNGKIPDPLCTEAARCIEALEAENERLIKAGDGDAGLIHWQGERIQKLETALREIARLRTDLRGDFSLGSKQSDIARAALGEKQ
jgi:hypothetical protein